MNCLVNVRCTLGCIVASLTAHEGLDIAESDVGLTSILIFIRTGIHRRIVANILP